MIAHIQGTIIGSTKQSVIVATQSGIGYEVVLPTYKLLELNTGVPVSFFIYHKVSENSQELFGFSSILEREFFMLLMTVSGIGPKSAMNIMSLGSIEDIRDAIARGDIGYLTAIQGMGKKTAERLVVELKSKIELGTRVSVRSKPADGVLDDVIEGLISMGYSKDESRDMLQNVEGEGKSAAEILKEVLSKKR
ncbi:MAG TPA: Holliday junction branch migration protein RuvA [Candidatus Magasanikbacteria bacterium]|nr:Holliday junction branch migration protein RuvA [Candidatus Magasanikbacteria bacterium]